MSNSFRPPDHGESPVKTAWKRFRADRLALAALPLVALLVLLALAAPLLANPRPLLEYQPGIGVRLPFLRSFFAPESTEYCIEQIFNYGLLALLVLPWTHWLPRRHKIRTAVRLGLAMLLILPFVLAKPRLERVDYRNTPPAQGFRLMAPLPYGPYEQLAAPNAAPSGAHPLGCDDLGRDLATRILYGARVSLAVGMLATALALLIGVLIGVSSGYWGGWYDLGVMRAVEILMCFPVFLLLLILMAIFQDCKFEQSLLAVIGVIALTGWIGMAQLARGEVLKQREMVYVQAAQVLGVRPVRIMLVHILPNILGTVLIAFSFGVAGAILAESSLSFLGFGVHPPTASWGGMLRSAFGDPLSAWHMTLYPGLMLFWAVAGFNFLGEGLRKAFDPRGD